MNFEQLYRRAEIIEKQYPPGIRLELIRMMDLYAPVEGGTRGTVVGVDDATSFLMRWDNRSTLSIVPEEDQFGALTKEET